MSAFLGPIHVWLYNKIQIQNDIVEAISTIGEDIIPNLTEELNSRYGMSEKRPLEEVIDGGNIHGWLQERVSQAEYKLAYSITALLQKDSNLTSKIENVFYEKGKASSAMIGHGNASDAYKVISDCLLDGMPCDHANAVIEESEEKVIWKRNVCVHQDYWDEVGGNIDNYYKFREAFIKGVLQGTSLDYEKVDEITNVIKSA